MNQYSYEELSESAKQAARDWYREDEGHLSYDWWDSVYEDAAQVADILGIDIRTREVRLQNGKVLRNQINIQFSGFCSQGDGAQFNGHYQHGKEGYLKIREHAPGDEALRAIADELELLQRLHKFTIHANAKHSGHYVHENCTDIDVYIDTSDQPELDGLELRDGAHERIRELLRDFMRWIYRRLEAEYDHLNSDETIAESICNNNHVFSEDGKHLD